MNTDILPGGRCFNVFNADFFIFFGLKSKRVHQVVVRHALKKPFRGLFSFNRDKEVAVDVKIVPAVKILGSFFKHIVFTVWSK